MRFDARIWRSQLFWLTLASVAGCATTSNLPASPPGVVPESITVTSRSFSSGGPIPIDCTCDGKNTSPDVTWSSPPEATKTLVIVLDDLEPSKGVATRWMIVDVRPEVRSLPAGADPTSIGGKLLLNDSGEAAYRGPCPPRGDGHHFALRVIALDRTLGLPENADRERVNARMEGHVLGAGELVGTASR
jgi:Raf kinase inhibitor-like YbhB/YbcL family protein